MDNMNIITIPDIADPNLGGIQDGGYYNKYQKYLYY